jgi:uncharacterized protein (TIRG00374 family)
MNKDNKKKIFNFCFIAFSSLILIYIMIQSNDISSIYDVLKSIKLQYVLIAVGCLFMFWLLEAYMIFKLILKFTDKKMNFATFWLAVKTTLVGQYYSNITPGASGGQPVQLFVMKDENVPISEGTAILVEKFLLFQVGVTVYSLALAIYKLKTLLEFSNGATWFVMIGLIVNVVMILCIWLISIKPKLIRHIIGFFINFLAKCKIIKDLNKAQNSFDEFIENYEISIKKMKSNKKLTIKLFALTFIQLTLFFSITYFIYKSFNLSGNSIFEIICLQSFVYMSVSFIPIPGTIGASEVGFVLLLGNVFSKNIIGAAILLWRGISYYFSLIFSGIFVILISIFKKYKTI